MDFGAAFLAIYNFLTQQQQSVPQSVSNNTSTTDIKLRRDGKADLRKKKLDPKQQNDRNKTVETNRAKLQTLEKFVFCSYDVFSKKRNLKLFAFPFSV